MEPTLTEDEEDKRVVDSDGRPVGTIRKVDQGVAHVEPDSDVAESVKERLDWDDSGTDDYTLQETAVAEITDDEVVLRDEG